MSDFIRVLTAAPPLPFPPAPAPTPAPVRHGAGLLPLPPLRRGLPPGGSFDGVSLLGGARQVEMAGVGLAVPVLQERSGEGGGRGDSDRDGRDRGGGEEAPDSSAVEVMDFRVRAIGDAVAMVCRFESAQVVWSARIPLDAGLLPATVLFLDYSPGVLELRFETSRWDVRELLNGQVGLLVCAVRELLPVGFYVGVSV